MADARMLRKQVMQRHAAGKSERSSWDTLCREVTDYLLPYAGRYSLSDVNRGDRRNLKIIDSTATRRARGLSAALMSYNNSPARPWFALTLGDPDLAEYHPVKMWLTDVTQQMHRVIAAGNTYRTFHKMYDEMIAFGTAVSIVRPDFESVLWHYPVTNGQFWLADSSKGDIDVCFREFDMTVRQIVRQFGLENCSDGVKQAVTQGNWETRFTVIHAIMPREDRNPMRRDGLNKKFMSVYLEAGGRDDQILREDGFDQFPVLAPRWDTTGGDVYGNGPGFECLGHIKQLQLMAEQEAKAIEYGVEPPLQGPSALKDKDVDRLPGGFTAVDLANPASKVQEMWRVQLDLNHLLLSKQDVRRQVDESFFADVFQQFLSLNDSTQRTATEIQARQNEIMTILGPVAASTQREMHGPFIEMLFSELLQADALPPMPEELSGAQLNVEYVSVLAQAQKSVGANNMDRFMGAIGVLAQIKPDVLDKVDSDRWVEEYADRLGIDPDQIVPGEEVALIRQKRNEANAAKEQALMMEQQAGTAKALSETAVGGPQRSALDALTGYGG